MPAHDQGVSSFSCVVGADQAGPVLAAGETVLNYLGANLTAAAATATLTIFDGTSGGGVVLATLSCVANTSIGDLVPTFIAVKDTSNGIHYTLTGAGATAQIRTNKG